MAGRVELLNFLAENNVDASVGAFLTSTLQFESVSDFANFWLRAEYAQGVQDDIISQMPQWRNTAAGKIQVSRLRAAWQKAQSLPPKMPESLQSAPPQIGFCEKTGLEAGGHSQGGALNAAQVEHLGDGVFKDGLHKPKWDNEGLHKPHTIGGKTYETGFHYLLEAHELGGKNKDGGFGGPLCKDPYGPQITQLTNVLLAEGQQDKTLCYRNFQDPCPQLTKKQVELCKGFDYGDKTLKLPCGPLPWPAGIPEPGYVPKTNPLNGRWITISGGQKEFIKASIDAGMLGAAEAKKIVADTDHEQTGGMYLRINQRGDTCTVDASVAKYARAKRTWRSGHYFYEPLVSGGNLLGVWVLPEEYRKIGFFWEMDSGRCFRIERRAFPRDGFTFLRQATEVNGKISFVFYVKVSPDPESQIIPVQSRDFTALAGHDNAPDNLGRPYPCTAKDLDWPTKRDTWLEQNEKMMLKQRNMVGGAFAHCCDNGFEVHDNTVGGPVNAGHVESLGKEHFEDGLHKPKFHEDGLHKPMNAGGKVYSTGFHYLLEAHELGGKSADGGYGGPLCADPYGDEVKGMVDNLLAQADVDNTLCYHDFKDPCPELTQAQVAQCKGFDYADKTLKLPCGPLPWPTGLPHPGYKPKTNPLHGRWITVSGGQTGFIKEAIKTGMLGASEAKKIISDTDHEKTGGMYLRINQFSDTCTVDASVAKYARAKRTWRSGHYFYEPLVSGGNLLGVWVLPEEYRKIGFFYEMNSGKCFRLERRAFPCGPYMFLRQCCEVNGKKCYVFYIKVDTDPGSKPIPVQSRCFTALAGQNNVCDNLGNPYPCTGKDLDYPKARDTWMDTNKEAMLDQQKKVDAAFANVCEKGFEVTGNEKGGALNGQQIAKFGDNFKDGLHQPTFHEDGLHKPMEAGGKTYESGFHYLLECHELGGKNEKGGYGGPLCEDPYGAEVSHLIEKLLKEAEDDKTLCYNNFHDPCPQLTKEQVAMCKGFDYGDKFLKLPCGPLPWPAGCPEPGYVPKTNPLTGRWITVSGGQAEFIREAIKTGMLGAAEANKIQADTDHEKTGGMYLRINQFGDQCTVDASVAKYARAKRTWRSGHYFYEPLVSGGNLLGVWVLPEEYRKIGFFWEMESGKCFRIERRAFPAGPYTILRQSTEVAGKISFVFYIKVDNDPGSKPIPVQSRDFTALAGQDNVCTNLGKPYPCIAKDLDYPKKRDTWLDDNKAEMLRQRNVVGEAFKAGSKVSDTQYVGMGWTSPPITSTTYDGLWASLVLNARNVEKFMDVSDVSVSDRPGFLCRSMTVTATKERVEEHIYADERKGEMRYRKVDSKSKSETDDERVILVKEEPLRMEFFHRHASDGYRVYWRAPTTKVEKFCNDIISHAGTMEKGIVGLGVRSETITGVSHDTMWRAMMESIREPQRFFACSNVTIRDCSGFVQRTLTCNGETYTENIYDDESSCEISYRKLVNGAEAEVERVVSLRTHPLQVEFHQRSILDGFRVHWTMPSKAALSSVDSFVREARRMDSTPPTVVGYGITSDPIRECSFDSLMVAIQTLIKQPWKAINVSESSVSVRDCAGYTERTMTLQASGEVVTERIVVNEEIGEVTYNKCDSSGRPGSTERVLAIRTPLRLEFYERNTMNKVRVLWSAPFETARTTFENIVTVAKKVETSSGDVIGFGIASKPLTRATPESAWKAMLAVMRNPDKNGMKVDSVTHRDMSGYMVRTMRLLEKPGAPTVTDNIRVQERAQEITFRAVSNGLESEEERVFALRLDPVRLEMFKRHSKDEMRLDWQAPRAVANDIFAAVDRVA